MAKAVFQYAQLGKMNAGRKDQAISILAEARRVWWRGKGLSAEAAARHAMEFAKSSKGENGWKLDRQVQELYGYRWNVVSKKYEVGQ